MLREDIELRVQEKLAGIADQVIKKHLFAHATNADNLRKILQSGKLAPLKSVADDAANALVNVESGLTSFGGREALPAAEAVAKMAPYKEIDKVFLTREGYLPEYGDHIIARTMPSPQKRVALNLMPEEYISDKALPLKGSDVFVPDEALAQWQKEFPGVGFKPRSAFTGKEYSRMHGLAELPSKLWQMLRTKVLDPAGSALESASRRSGLSAKLEELRAMFMGKQSVTADQIAAASENDLQKLLYPGATPVGSSALGINLDSSDMDILLPFASQEAMTKALADVPERFPGFRPSSLNKGRPLQVYKGRAGDKNIDLVFAHGDPAFAYRDAVNRAKAALTDEQRYAILAEKERLKNAWLFPEMRYKNYKMQLSKDLGTLTQDIWKNTPGG